MCFCRAERWLVACNREDLLEKVDKLHSYRLCAAHFEDKMFMNDLKTRLVPTALPTIFLCLEGSSSQHKHVEHNYCVASGQTWNSTTKRPLNLVPDAAKSEEHIPADDSEPPQKIKILSDVVLDKPISFPIFSPTETPVPVSPPRSSPGSTQTELKLSGGTPRKEKLRQCIKRLRNENSQLQKKNQQLQEDVDKHTHTDINNISLQQYMQLTHKFCPSQELATFINTQISQVQKHPKGRRYSLGFKNECLAMYFAGPKLYRKKLMRQFCLPSPKTLLKLVKNLKMGVGVNNPELFKMLHMKIRNFSEEDKLCLLCVDEMAIKANLFYGTGSDSIIGLEDNGTGKKVFKPALTATVFMIRGLRNKWSQPICYNFFHSTCPAQTLKQTINDLVTKLKEIGLTVCALTSDMGSNNIQLKNILEVTPSKPYFFVNEQKIFYMFDIPHLLKAVRNMLQKHNFVDKHGQEISWKYLEQFYNHDKNYPDRAAPKLTDSHIYPTNFEKMKVKFASQLFSKTVACGLNVYIRFGVLPASATKTALFVEMMDKLFDLLNSSHTSNAKEFNRAFKGEQYQLDFLNECLNFFSEVKVVDKTGKDVTNRMKFVNCFIITIKGLIQLWDCLSEKFKFLFTRRLNQDVLENFFGTIRQQNGNCVNPTAIQFQRSFKKLLCVKLFHSGTENCEGDTDSMLLKLNDINVVDEAATDPLPDNEPVIDCDYHTSDIVQKNFERYVCGYLIRKCLRIHTCSVCVDYANSVKDLDDTTLFCYFKAYENTKMSTFGNLMMPDDNFVSYISKLHIVFQSHFEELSMYTNILKQFMQLCENISFQHPCNNFPHSYVTKLYFRFRIFYTLKRINRNFKCPNKNKLIIWRHQ